MTTVDGMASSTAERLAAIRSRIIRACERSDRDPAGVTVLAVSKTFPERAVAAAYDAGLRDFGENRVQEAVRKIDIARPHVADANWHFIGHLQTNKVRAITGVFVILHAIDSVRLLNAVSAEATRPQRVLLEVNVAGEASKFGIAPADVAEVVLQAARLPNIIVEGLMTVAPRVTNPDDVRPVFRELRRLARENSLGTLSMGMSEDFEVAIEEGATYVRIGRGLFGERS